MLPENFSNRTPLQSCVSPSPPNRNLGCAPDYHFKTLSYSEKTLLTMEATTNSDDVSEQLKHPTSIVVHTMRRKIPPFTHIFVIYSQLLVNTFNLIKAVQSLINIEHACKSRYMTHVLRKGRIYTGCTQVTEFDQQFYTYVANQTLF